MSQIERSGGTAYTGTLTNRLDVPVSDPKVTIFPVNRAGRPLGAVTSSASLEIPAGGIWNFQTALVPELGADYVAFPVATPLL